MSDVDDARLRQIRENVAGLLAVIIVVMFLALIGISFIYVRDDKAFTQAKELVAVVNSVAGIVIGYYFSRMTGEARAEKAESTAAASAETAKAAVDTKVQAEKKVDELTADGQQVASALEGLKSAVAPLATAGALPPNQAGMDPVQLRVALNEAERALTRTARNFKK